MSRVRENRTHGSRRRELETEHPVMVTAVKRPAGETRGKWLRDLKPEKCHRASSRPYSKAEADTRHITPMQADTRAEADIAGKARSSR